MSLKTSASLFCSSGPPGLPAPGFSPLPGFCVTSVLGRRSPPVPVWFWSCGLLRIPRLACCRSRCPWEDRELLDSDELELEELEELDELDELLACCCCCCWRCLMSDS